MRPRPVRGPRMLIREHQTVRCAGKWEACRDVLDGEALTMILRSPWPWAEVVLRSPEELERGWARGIPPRLVRRHLERNIAMVMFPQWKHDSFTSAASACWKPKHEGQRSWPSDEARKWPHPETHEREAIFKKTPVARRALFALRNSLLEALKCPGEEAARPPKKAFYFFFAALDSDLRWHAVTPTLSALQTLWRLRKARLRSEKLLCVCTRSPFIPAPRGGVRVAKHACQCHWLVLLTLEGDWALRRDPLVSHSDVTSNVTDW